MNGFGWVPLELYGEPRFYVFIKTKKLQFYKKKPTFYKVAMGGTYQAKLSHNLRTFGINLDT